MQLFAIFGDPVAHSKSPLMHNAVFENLHYPACYTRVNLKDGTRLKETFLNLKLSGANVTVPHKEAAFKACDEIRGFAQKVGVVNTIVLENGKLIGYNTDADGFMYAIESFGKIEKILVLGAGGTAKALVQKFIDEGLQVSLLNRSQKRLEAFVSLPVACYTWENFKVASYDLVVNTTSAGLGDESLPAPKELIDTILAHTKYVADAIYGKLTPFLGLAQEKDLPFIDGSAMLLGQGVLANELFTRQTLPKDSIAKEMQRALGL